MSNNNHSSFDILTILKISGAFLAYLIGSGFATGQEAMQFFVSFGYSGLYGTLICFVFLNYLCFSFLTVGRKYNLKSNEDIFVHYCGKYAGKFLVWYTMILIVAVNAIMLSGAGATLEQSYGIPSYIGSGIMAALSMATLILGLQRIIDIISVIGPTIIVLTVAIAILTLFENPTTIDNGMKTISELEILSSSSHWLMSSMLYIGLLILGLACFLPALGRTINNSMNIKISAFLGPLFYFSALILVILALVTDIESIYQDQIPIMSLAHDVLPIYGSIFAVIIFSGIYTTITPLQWTVCARFAEDKTPKYKVIVISLTCLCYFGGMVLPFGELVNIIYPTVGYAGLTFLSFMIISDVNRFIISKRST